MNDVYTTVSKSWDVTYTTQECFPERKSKTKPSHALLASGLGYDESRCYRSANQEHAT